MFSVTLITVCELSTDILRYSRDRESWTLLLLACMLWNRSQCHSGGGSKLGRLMSGAGAGDDGGGGDDGGSDGAVSTMDRDSLPLCLSRSVILSD